MLGILWIYVIEAMYEYLFHARIDLPIFSVIADGSNQFVAVTFDPNSNTFTCSFLNQQDASRKLCSLSYGFDRQQLTFTANDSNTSATVSLVLATDIQKERQFFFIVTASNSTYTLTVEGSQIIRLSKSCC